MRANRYISYLAAEIEPAALANMQTFEREAQRTMQSIANASSKGSGGLASAGFSNTFSRNTDAITRGARGARSELDALAPTQIKVGKAAELMGAGFGRAADALQIVQGPLGPIAGRLSALGQVLRQLTGFSLAGVLAGGGAFALGSISTQYQRMHDTLVPLFDDQKKLNYAIGDVIGIAQRTRQALEPVAALYGQITRVAKDAGLSIQQTSRLTETVSKASRIGGGTQEAQQAAIVQFTQALTANFHGSGQELQSILEQAPALAQAIANGLGVQTSKLKELAKEGQLSTALVVQALERSADDIDRRFSLLPQRIGTATTELSNNLAVFVGRLDETTGATSKVAGAISFLANNLGLVTTAAVTMAAAFGANTFAGAVKGIGDVVFRLAAIAPLTREQIATNEIFKRTIQERAALELQEAQAQFAAAKQQQTQLQTNIALIERQIVAEAQALEMTRTLDAAMRTSGGTGSAPALVAAYDNLNTSERALIATQEALIASDAELAAAETRLTAATMGLAVANDELIVAETAAAASSGRLAGVKALLSGAMGRVQGAASGLVRFLGGPWGVAFTAAAGWVTYLASKHDYAKEAIDRFKGGEEGLIEVLERTTGKTWEQVQATQALAKAFRDADLAKAKSSARDVGTQLSSDLLSLRNRLPIGGADFKAVDRLTAAARNGTFMPTREGVQLSQIIARNPGAAQQNPLDWMLGRDPSRTIEDVKGLAAAMINYRDTQKDIEAANARLNAKQAPLIPGGGVGKPITKADLNRQAAVNAAQDALSKARADLALAKAKGPLEGETNDQYVQRIAALIQNVNGLVQAHKSAAAAKAEERHQQALLNKEMAEAEKARDRGMKLAGIDDQFTEDSPIKRLDRLTKAANTAKRAIDDLVGERVIDDRGDRIFSQTDAEREKARIDAYTARETYRPVTDSLNQTQSELRIQQLLARGLGDQAEFTRRKYELEKQVGELLPEEAAAIRAQIADEHKINDALYERSQIIENNGRLLDGFRDALKSSVQSLLEGDAKGGFEKLFKGIYQSFAEARANEIVMKLIGDPGKTYRDEMTRGLNDAGTNLSSSANLLSDSARALNDAAAAVASIGSSAGGGDGAAGAIPTAGALADSASAYSEIGDLLSEGMDPAVAALYDLQAPLQEIASSVDDSVEQIVVIGKRLASGQPVGGATKTLNALGSVIAGKLGIGGVGAQALGSIGTGLQWGGYGAAGASVINSVFGTNLSTTGAGIGGAIGSIAGSIIPGVGTVIGGIVGSVLGGVIGSIFGGGSKPKKPSGSATLTGSGAPSYYGSSETQQASLSMASSVQSGLQRIVEALDGTLGSYRVSVGVNEAGQYVVDPSGSGKTSGWGTSAYNDQTAAARAAILNAIMDGAVQGISDGAKRLLQAGQDLDAALTKALKFEQVFKDLKHLKDPVGAAIDDLNDKFNDLINIFVQAGASAGEWAQLQELYDLQRAEAIKQATHDAVQLLQDFITSMTSGTESPLSKQSVYNNAKAAVNAFRADIAAGKPVDQQALVTALQNFEAASQDLYGSRAQFYSDLNDVLALAEAAKTNIETDTTGLPPSPFDTLTPIAAQQLLAQNLMVSSLSSIVGLLQYIASKPGGVTTPDPPPTTIPSLPGNGGVPPPPTDGYTGGTIGGDYGGDTCVAAYAWVEVRDPYDTPAVIAAGRYWVRGEHVRWREAERPGHFIRDLQPDGSTTWAEVLSNHVQPQPAVRLTLADGSEVDCSHSTPITLQDGSSIYAPDADGHELAGDSDGRADWQQCSVKDIGTIDVAFISAGGATYLAGNQPARGIYTHNIYKIPRAVDRISNFFAD